jgi:carbonic anhydrase/acetyltransferase-like protein (isoleucine patch superfamily)
MLYSFRNKEPKFGKEAYISEHALLIGDVTVGDNCYIGHGAILRGDYGRIVIGAGSAVEEGVVVHAPPDNVCQIGERVTLGHGAIIHSLSIGNLCVIGMGVVVSIGAQVGEKTIIAEGSVVKMRQIIPPEVVAAGSPVKILRKITPDDINFWDNVKRIYVNLAREYLQDGMHKIDLRDR